MCARPAHALAGCKVTSKVSGGDRLSGFLLVVVGTYVLIAGVQLLSGVLLIQSHELDGIHAVAGALLVAGGNLPHVDFMTPLGIGAFAPVALFLVLGCSVGISFILAQLLVALLLLPCIVWVAYSRLTRGWQELMAVTLIIMATALTAGGVERYLEISMYYNRWAWCIAILISLLILLPARSDKGLGWFDAFFIGIGLALLVLIKMTFFVGIAPACAAYFVMNRDWRGTLLAITMSLVCLAIVTAFVEGPIYWLKYFEDLRSLVQSDSRPFPSDAKRFLQQFDTFVLLFVLVLSILRVWNTGSSRPAACLLLLGPGFIYIAFQNWGNDPLWLFPLARLVVVMAWVTLIFLRTASHFRSLR